MLRITVLSENPREAELRLEGRIVGEWAKLLERECGALLKRVSVLVLDLGGVSYLDVTGGDVLAALPGHRVRLRNQNPILQELVDERRAR